MHAASRESGSSFTRRNTKRVAAKHRATTLFEKEGAALEEPEGERVSALKYSYRTPPPLPPLTEYHRSSAKIYKEVRAGSPTSPSHTTAPRCRLDLTSRASTLPNFVPWDICHCRETRVPNMVMRPSASPRRGIHHSSVLRSSILFVITRAPG